MSYIARQLMSAVSELKKLKAMPDSPMVRHQIMLHERDIKRMERILERQESEPTNWKEDFKNCFKAIEEEDQSQAT